MSIKTAVVVLAALTSAATVGCGKGGSAIPDNQNADTTSASLHRAKDCTGLLGDLQADAKFKLDRSIDYQIQGIKACEAHYADSQCASYGGYYNGGGPVDVAGGTNVAAPEASNATASASDSTAGSSSSGGAKSAGATDFSQTNTQVEGVDEADIVKNDGENLYVLHGRAFKVIHAFPATAMSEVGSIDIEGTPNEMFVSNGTVVVYSDVNGANVFTAANVKVRSSYVDFGYAISNAESGSDIAPTTAPDEPVGVGTAPAVYVPLTKVTVLTLANGTAPVVTRESYFEGSYLDSRRVGTSVRSVFQGNTFGPALKYGIYDLTEPTGAALPSPETGTQMIAELEQLRQANYAIIDASVIGDWLPYTFVKSGSTTTASTTACSDFYVPTIGSTESGVTEVSTIDLGDPNGTPRDTAILGAASVVYASADDMYIAAQAWVEQPYAWYDTYGSTGTDSGGTVVASPPSSGSVDAGVASPPTATDGGVATKSLSPLTAPTMQGGPAIVTGWSQANTHVHKFEFTTDPHFANYLASGTVAGTINDQFSMDELNGNLRIATTENRSYYSSAGDYVTPDYTTVAKGAPAPTNPSTVNHVFVLGQNGGSLDTIGTVGDLAPNETIESVRFVNTKGYVTTYRQVDPLFVFDLSNAQKPTELGELTIAGFSEYMQPIDDNHLITIGRDATNELELQIFDVTNPAAPNRTFATTYTGGDYASSDAEFDHKAFTYFADKGLLAIPFYSYGYTSTDGSSIHSSLEVFKVDINTGISWIGSVDDTSLVAKYPNGYCGGYYGPTVRRGVFLDTTVYAVTYGGIAAKDVGNLAAPALTYALPPPVENDVYGSAQPDVAVAACYVDPGPVVVSPVEPVDGGAADAGTGK